MTALWTDLDAAQATGGTATAPFAVTGLSIDSRSIAQAEMFVALTDQRDGHDFVAAAFEAGAAAALVSRIPEGLPAGAPLLLVPDVLEALRALATAARARTKARVIAVTGSVGKTSTKEMLRHVLARQGQVHAAEKSFNNHWGVPLTLARCPQDAEFAVIEIGMNHPGEIAPLAQLAAPDAAVITTVAAAHLEAFSGLDGIAREKASIFTGLRRGGAAIINGDLDTSAILARAADAAEARLRLFGIAPGVAARLRSLELVEANTLVEVILGDRPIRFRLPTAGRHFAMNALATLLAVEAVGGDVQKAAADLADWQPPQGRGTRETLVLPQGEITLLDDAYNANPTSMGAAFEVLAAHAPAPGAARIAVLGDMLELGSTEAELHAGLAGHPALAAASTVICVGPRMASLHAALPAGQRGPAFADAAAAAEAVPGLVSAGDVVLVKGSLGSKVSQVVTSLRKAAEQGT